MPRNKRKRPDDDFEHISRKIKKLEKKLSRARRDRDTSQSSDSTPSSPQGKTLVDIGEQDIADPPLQCSVVAEVEDNPNTQEMEESCDELGKDVLEILGEDPTISTEQGKEIHKDLASRLEHISVSGLSKELRKELMLQYVCPSNATHLGAPLLNNEIKAALPEAAINRDKAIEAKQKLLTCAISCLASTMSDILVSKDKNKEILKKLMDASLILCDIQHADSLTRRRFSCSTSIPPSSIEIMLASLSKNSYKQYDSCLRNWYNFCTKNNKNVYEASIPTVIYFLTQLFNAGNQYGTLNSHRAALSLILGTNKSSDDRIKRFFKGVFRLRPPAPKYNITWDTNQVLDTLESWYPNDSLTLEDLSKKCITVLALTTAHRVQTLSQIHIENIEIHPSQISIKIPDLIKTSRVGTNQPILNLPFFQQKPEICPAQTLIAYIGKTDSFRKYNKLFVSHKKPYNVVTSQTLSRWIKDTLKKCGIDTSLFSAHSTRHASTSKAYKSGISVDQIQKTAGWSGSSSTFAKFYNCPISNNDQTAFARSILDHD